MRAPCIAFLLLALFLVPALDARAVTVSNDDSCDIALLPAATLLLPYFEVAPDRGKSTLFTVTNVSAREQVVRVTLWTDYAYPVLTFNVYLTGYDSQNINLFDVIFAGQIAPSRGTGTEPSRTGDFSDSSDVLDLSNCARIPSQLDPQSIARVREAFTAGRVRGHGSTPACETVGGAHDDAIGYATMDLVRNCGDATPLEASYYESDLMFDNVLVGDSQRIDSAENQAEGSPLVHIRAIPEGGTAAERRSRPNQYRVDFRRTFYSRYLPAGMELFDARQPLPAQFGARWIDSAALGYETHLKIWRGDAASSAVGCSSYRDNIAPATDVVVFDEDENPEGYRGSLLPWEARLPATSSARVSDSALFPRVTSGGVGGWVYLNLDSRGQDSRGQDSRGEHAAASQNWVISSMRAGGTLAVDSEAIAFGNGCTPAASVSEVSNRGGTVIGPAANSNP